MKTVAEALTEVMACFAPLPDVRCALEAAHGGFVAEALRATADAPPFDASQMDGYALRAEDSPGALPVRGEARAGVEAGELEACTAWRIYTGAPVPRGADAVVMQEETQREGDVVRVARAVRAGEFVRKRGSELAARAVMLEPGARVDAGAIALCASQDVTHVAVHRRPRVAILSAGDELRAPGEPARPGSIVDANAPLLAALVREAGGEPWVLPRAQDDRAELGARVREALASSDVVLSSGGVSVGAHDHMRGAFEDCGVRLAFVQVAMKPGKPLSFGLHGATPVCGLPGNPASAFVTFELFVRPGLRRMLGDPRPFRARIDVVLDAPVRHAPGRLELARATLDRDASGLLRARLHPQQASGAIASLAGCDALVLLPADVESFAGGQVLQAIDLHSAASFTPFAR